MGRFAAWCGAVVCGLAAAVAFAGQISQVTPTAASVGAELSITGDGFGTAKPRVALVPSGGGKPLALKVTGTPSDTAVTAVLKTVRKFGTGPFDLVVTPAGKDAVPITLPAAISLDVGQIATVTPAAPAASGTVTIDGSQFGTKKGKVKVGGKAAKVTLWTDTQVQAKLHKKTPAGSQSLELINKLGTAVKVDAVDVGGSGGGGNPGVNSLRARIYRTNIVAAGENVVVRAKGTGFTIVATSSRSGTTHTLTIDLSNYDAAAGTTKVERVEPVLFEVTVNDGAATTWRAAPGLAMVEIQKLPDGSFRSRDFGGDFARVSGSGDPDPLDVHGTVFDISLP